VEVGVVNVIVLLPWVAPKPEPASVRFIGDDEPDVGVTLVMVAAGLTVKRLPLLAMPLTVTTTFPVVALAGTVV